MEEAESEPPIVKSWRDAGDTLSRQNFDHSIPPANTENLHFTLNRETMRAPGPPVAHAQMAWEDTDKVSFMVPWYSHRNPGPEQHSPLDRLTSTRGKKRN
jgi:hypothetical protein